MAVENLRNEGVAAEKIHFVGNTMIDALHQHIGRARELPNYRFRIAWRRHGDARHGEKPTIER